MNSNSANKDLNTLKIKLTGPRFANSGDNVTLIGKLEGLNDDQITDARFTQESGPNVSYSTCERNNPICTISSYYVCDA